MIHTLTLDPSIDYIIKVKSFYLGNLNYAENGSMQPGGKGINVSIVLHRLGIENIAYGFVGGFTGLEIEHRLCEMKCQTDFVHLKSGVSRVNIKLKAAEETEINGIGPEISDKELLALMKKLDRVKKNDFVVLSGRVPKSMPDNIYNTIMQIMEKKGARIIVDAAQSLLVNALSCKPFLIKPNQLELSTCVGKDLNTMDEIIWGAKLLQGKGARNVMVSLADKGALLVTETGEWYFEKAPAGKAVNSVGAGDSMVAGFIEGYMRTHDYGMALKMGVVCGSASAFSQWLPEKEDINALYNSLC